MFVIKNNLYILPLLSHILPLDHLWITSGSPPDHFRTTSGSLPDHFRITSGSPPDHIRITSDPARIASGSHPIRPYAYIYSLYYHTFPPISGHLRPHFRAFPLISAHFPSAQFRTIPLNSAHFCLDIFYVILSFFFLFLHVICCCSFL